jgi:hypothetical protein
VGATCYALLPFGQIVGAVHYPTGYLAKGDPASLALFTELPRLDAKHASGLGLKVERENDGISAHGSRLAGRSITFRPRSVS